MSYLDSLRQKLDLPVIVPVSYYYKASVSKTDKTVLLLHGYQDSASSLFKRAFGETDSNFDFNILAPNGIYPVPVRAEEGFKEAYAWYFIDPKSKFALVRPEVARDNLLRVLKHLNLDGHKILIVGFSQGGILAPFVAHQLNCAGVVGLGTMFFEEYYRGLTSTLPVDAIHGIEDDVITLKTSQAGYEELKRLQPRPGDYYPIANLKHTLDDVARLKLKELIRERLLR